WWTGAARATRRPSMRSIGCGKSSGAPRWSRDWRSRTTDGMAYDILIRNGLLIDGTGSPGVGGDLAVADGRIAAIGPRLGDSATRVIDAQGLAVAPGFIDIKTPSDFTLPINPPAQ